MKITAKEKQILFVSCIVGFAVCYSISLISGRKEAWDSPLYFMIGIPVMAVSFFYLLSISGKGLALDCRTSGRAIHRTLFEWKFMEFMAAVHHCDDHIFSPAICCGTSGSENGQEKLERFVHGHNKGVCAILRRTI